MFQIQWSSPWTVLALILFIILVVEAPVASRHVKYRKIDGRLLQVTKEQFLRPSKFLIDNNFVDTFPFEPLPSIVWTDLKKMLEKKVAEQKLPPDLVPRYKDGENWRRNLGERKWRIISLSKENRVAYALSIIQKDVLDVHGPQWSRYDYIITKNTGMMQGNTVFNIIESLYSNSTFNFKKNQWN